MNVGFNCEIGWCDYSPVAFSTTGLILAGVLKDLKSSARYGKYAMSMLEKLQARNVESRCMLLLHAFVFPWTLPVQSRLKPLLRCYELGMQTGDIESGLYGLHFFLTISLVSGKPLEGIEQDCQIYSLQMEELGMQFSLINLKIIWQVVLNLMGKSENTTVLAGDAMNEEEMDRWSSELEFSYSLEEGNGDSEELDGRWDIKYTGKRFVNTTRIEAENESEEVQATGKMVRITEEYLFNNKTDFEKAYLYLEEDYEEDKFDEFENQTRVNVGIGRDFINTEKFKLQMEVGAGYYEDDPVIGNTITGEYYRFAEKFKWIIRKDIELGNELVYEVFEDRNHTQFDIYFSLLIAEKMMFSESLWLKISHENEIDDPDVRTFGVDEVERDLTISLLLKL